MEYDVVIGLEVHIELSTEKKLFCGCKNEFTHEPNKNVCPVCLGLPGSLPVINQQAIEYFIKLSKALDCQISLSSKFDRKHYFYPDMPKNYQISQYDLPLATKGGLFLPNLNKYVYLRRIHLEEDTGKSIHIGGDNLREAKYTLLNYNRAGVPLVEIVTEPVIYSVDEAAEFLELLRLTALYLNVSDVKMEEGSLRCDANISLKPKNSDKLGTKVEIKNINSFRFLIRALNYEIERQSNILKSGKGVIQETRGWDEKTQTTYSMRTKEEAHDYRYFPEPDLLPLNLNQDYIDSIKIPKTPSHYYQEYLAFNLNNDEIMFLLENPKINDLFNVIISSNLEPRSIVKFLKTDFAYLCNNDQVNWERIQINNIIEYIKLAESKNIDILNSKRYLISILHEEIDILEFFKDKGLFIQEDTSLIEKVVDEIISKNSQAVDDYLQGKDKALGFLVGQAMKELKGKAKPNTVSELMINKLRAFIKS
ncbi:MAG: Asp-tRNA(Asn)/Glu-tRNA(Gln) amidotransferase subunit GatB [Candidatus Calescibacterium sp.]|nr:Asp-tRNA(Asn)/Glu-tRNA(Gln) amidotransferase subunit GatB [Candidatus Calescibacterium sp.]